MSGSDTIHFDKYREAMASASTKVCIDDTVTVVLNKDKEPKKWLVTTAPATFDKVALVSAALGMLVGIGAIFAVLKSIPIGIYMISMGAFHLLEFWVTARYNQSTLGMYSFLLTNGPFYAFAQLFAVVEYLLHQYSLPRGSGSSLLFCCSLTAVLAGQVIRTCAMIKAAKSFNHYVQVEKKPEHTLVNTGIYGKMRHPSYFGYYVWAVSTQLMIGNWFSSILFAIVLNFYFRSRLGPEETALINFFGDEYKSYKKAVWSGVFFYP